MLLPPPDSSSDMRLAASLCVWSFSISCLPLSSMAQLDPTADGWNTDAVTAVKEVFQSSSQVDASLIIIVGKSFSTLSLTNSVLVVLDAEVEISRYIGFTTTNLSKRITAHLQDGAIHRHYITEHELFLKRHHTENNTSILEKVSDIKRLRMTEATHIHLEKPSINIQQQEVSLPTKRLLPGRTQAQRLLALQPPALRHVR
ncbi:hypothetical protein O3P69_001820 [Scylla paramamosain]|uniref:Uncharacterized protein n=1 Tax=Scylla paramamosain TaxID=85552 RepID=A0AAW0UZT1_SCYPA